MNSDEEKTVLENNGWEYNYVSREWIAPDGTILTQDSLFEIMTSFGERAELELKIFASQHNKTER
jgi:hypothetical protein